MKKLLASILGVFMLASTACFAGCKEENTSTGITSDTLALPHYNGIITTDVDGEIVSDGSYDTDLLYYGERRIWGADEGVIYVSEEQGGAEYGGWFYMYLAGTGGGVNDKGQTTNVDPEGYPEGSNMMVLCYRSRDLNDWKLCGAIEGGWCLYLDPDTWVNRALWAAEVIYNPGDGKYWMYFTAQTKRNDGSIPGATYENYDDHIQNWARFSVGIACSDTPVGPFKMVSSERNYNGGPNPNGEMLSHVNPSIDVQKGLGLELKFPVIDCHPVFVDDGNPATFDMYLYFVKHLSIDLNIPGNTIWCMKMKDMATPDYQSIRWLLGNGYQQTVTYKGSGDPTDMDNSYTVTEYADKETDNRGTITEGPTMIMREQNGKMKYYLLSSPHGVNAPKYDVDIAVADSPMGPFTKVAYADGGRMLAVDSQNDFMSSLGHCSVVYAGTETYCVFGTSQFYGTNKDWGGRFYAFAPVGWYYEPAVGCELPMVNGPLQSLQPRPEVATGYSNVASKAKITYNNVKKDTLSYLTDGLVPTQARISHLETEANKTGTMTVTFAFDTPVSLRGVCVYNSYTYANAFKKVDYIAFDLAEETTIGGEKSKSVAIQDLPFDASYYDVERQIVRPGGASIATFKEIKVKKVTITVSAPLDELASELRISEIVLLGK